MHPKTLPAIVAILLLCAAAGGQAQAKAIHFQAEGHTFAISQSEFAGTAAVRLNCVPHDADVTTRVLDIRELPNGTLLARTSHTFDFGDGDTLVTDDQARLVPTRTPGLYELHSNLRITGGTGEFEGARGHLRGTSGTIDLIAGEARWTCSGVVNVRR